MSAPLWISNGSFSINAWASQNRAWNSDRTKTDSFERYIKPGSGHAFADKRLWQIAFR